MKVCNDYQEGLIKLPVYDASLLTRGQALKWGQDGTTTSINSLISVTNTAADIFAVLEEKPTTTTSNVGTPLVYQAQVSLVVPSRIHKIYYDLTVSTALAVTSSTSTVLTSATTDDDLDGSWLYIVSGTGAGQLRYVKAADTTTKTVNTAWTTTPDSTSKMIIIRNVGIPTGGTILNSTFSSLLSLLDATSAQKTIILKNFCEGPFGVQEMDVTRNGFLETDGLSNRGVRFFSHVIFFDTLIAATGL